MCLDVVIFMHILKPKCYIFVDIGFLKGQEVNCLLMLSLRFIF